MTQELGYQLPWQLGGPMNIGEGYRWNVPCVTYGFDSAFLNYFGTNGVAAVEEAVAQLNALPPASDLTSTSYPSIPLLPPNTTAATLNYLDLRSRALATLLQCLGLTVAQENVYTLRSMRVTGTSTNFIVAQRNFDPVTLTTTNLINGVLFSYSVRTGLRSSETQFYNDAEESRVSGNSSASGIAGISVTSGTVIGSPSADDVGGIKYLLRYGNITREGLLPDVRGAAPALTNWVNIALRPGVEKVTFVRQSFSAASGAFLPMTNRYTDAYFDGDQLKRQELERITTQPDILFTGRDLGLAYSNPILFAAGGVSNWLNNAALNGQPDGAGPGIIRPPMTIAFSTVGFYYYNYTTPGIRFLDERSASRGQSWARFDSENILVAFPRPSPDGSPTKLRLNFTLGNIARETSWNLYGPTGARFYLQHSADLRSWTNSAVVTNTGFPLTYFLPMDTVSRSVFYRALPE
ncbi:MAG: hypothetical protein HZA92_09205 [Verrucomicrobia bacterium]|nr:hypothetical protein [Verrucomicrobiota bacterium]